MIKNINIRKKMAEMINGSPLILTAYDYDKDNLTDDKLPAVTISTGGGAFTTGAEECEVDFRLEIKVKSVKASEIESDLDTFAEQLFNLFPIGDTLDNLVEYIKPESFEPHSVDPDGSIGTKGLNFNVKYEV